MDLVLFWAISTHTNTASLAHLSHLLKRSASEVHSVNTCIVSSCLRQGSVYFSDYQTPLSTLSELSSSPFCHHSINVFIGSTQTKLFSIPCGSTCCSFQNASAYKGSLSGKIGPIRNAKCCHYPGLQHTGDIVQYLSKGKIKTKNNKTLNHENKVSPAESHVALEAKEEKWVLRCFRSDGEGPLLTCNGR